MTDLLDTFLESLPAVTVEYIPLADNAAVVLTGEPGGQMIVISNYYGPTDQRPLMCKRHGLQRHNWDSKRERWDCCKCR